MSSSTDPNSCWGQFSPLIWHSMLFALREINGKLFCIHICCHIEDQQLLQCICWFNSWQTRNILGGCRGSAKEWMMRQSVRETNEKGTNDDVLSVFFCDSFHVFSTGCCRLWDWIWDSVFILYIPDDEIKMFSSASERNDVSYISHRTEGITNFGSVS